VLSEHKHCNNAATNANSENARSRMVVASSAGSVSTGAKEDESIIERVWAAVFHCYGPFSFGARCETYEQFIYIVFNFFFGSR
jgi:hypothetical protein